jgi:hypothetical protein
VSSVFSVEVRCWRCYVLCLMVDDDEILDEFLPAIRISKGTRLRIDRLQAKARLENGFRIPLADIVRAVIEDGLRAREGQSSG